VSHQIQATIKETNLSTYFGDNKIEEGHGRRSLRSGAVSLIARALNAFIQIGSILFLARLLSPEDYGLVSMVTAITGFAPLLVDLGTRDAVTQRPHITEGEVSALFWMTVGIGTACATLVAAAGPLIARFYHEPRLTTIAMVSGMTFITSALYCQHYALMRRAMKFRELGIIEVCANVLSAGGAITLALFGFHYWALVLRPVAMSFLLAVGVWARCRWVPPRPTLTPGVKDMVKFGLNSTGFTMTDFAGKSSDKVAIGYRSGPKALGYYQNAMTVYDNLLDVMVFPLHGVAVASLSKVRSDLKEFRRLWGKALSTLVFYAMPAYGILALTSRDLIVMLLGAKWTNAGILLSILALRGIPHSVERTLGWLHVSSGKTHRWMLYGVAALFAQLIALFIGLPYGPKGVVTAYVVYMFILFVPAIAYAGRPFNIGAKDVIKVVWRQLVGALLAAGVGFALRRTLLANSSGLAKTAILVAVFAIVYLVTVVGLLRLRMPVAVMLVLVKDYLPGPLTRLESMHRFISTYAGEHI
jgi:polysaccharide transporter, PST family